MSELNILLDSLIDDAWYEGLGSNGNEKDKYMTAQGDPQSIKQKIVAEFDALNQRIAYLEEVLRWRPMSERPTATGKYEIKHTSYLIEKQKYGICYYNVFRDEWEEFVPSMVSWRPIPEATE